MTTGCMAMNHIVMKEPRSDLEALLDARAVMRLLRCSLPLVYKMAERGQIPCVRIPCPRFGEGKTRDMVRFKKADVIAFIEQHYRI